MENSRFCPPRPRLLCKNSTTGRAVIGHCKIDHLADVANIRGIKPNARCGGVWVHSITSEDGRLKAERELRGNSLPHLPVRNIVKLRQKAAKLLVYASSNSNRSALNQLLSSDLSVPVIEQTRRFAVQFGELDPMSVRISDRVSTKDRASIAALGPFAHTIVEARQHNIVLMQNVHPMTSRPLNASIPGIRQPSIFGFAMERHPPGAHSLSNFKCRTIVRAVI